MQPATVDFVYTPKTNQALYFNGQFNITYKASNGVPRVNISLWHTWPLNPAYIIKVFDIVLNTPNTGRWLWQIPVCRPQRDFPRTIFDPHPSSQPSAGGYPVNSPDYIVLIYDAANRAPTYRNSGFFSLGPVPTGNCAAGSYSSTGQHPCTLCPLGTYSLNATYCQPCAANTTTRDLGGKTQNDCSLNLTNPLFAFAKTAGAFFVGSNAGGAYIESHEHKVRGRGTECR